MERLLTVGKEFLEQSCPENFPSLLKDLLQVADKAQKSLELFTSPTATEKVIGSFIDGRRHHNRCMKLLFFHTEKPYARQTDIILALRFVANRMILFMNSPYSPSSRVHVLHPINLEYTNNRRFYHIHGFLNWMFPINRTQQDFMVLKRAGADIVFKEIKNLSHTYLREENVHILKWLDSSIMLFEN